MAARHASHVRARPLLGTIVEIAARAATPADTEHAIEAAFDAIATVHRLMSFHECDSDIGRINRAGRTQPVAVHPWTFEVLELAEDLRRASDGAFDIAVAPHLQARGLLPTDDGPRAAAIGGPSLALLPDHRVTRAQAGTRVDLGGIAKGFAVDRAVATLQRFGVEDGLVNAGGDLRTFGEARRIVIRDPRVPDRALTEVALSSAALASSGGSFDPLESRLAGESTTFDPATGEPVRAIRGASVVADAAIVADALSKVVMIKGADALPVLARYRASALFVTDDGAVRASSNWPDLDLAA